jgi:VWFA-related protein
MKTGMCVALGLVLAPACLWAQDAAKADPTKDHDDPKPVEKVAPPSTIPVLVREHKGGAVVDLPQTAFTVKFDGKVLPLSTVERGASVPVTYGLLVDVGAGQRNAIDDVRKAAREFVSRLRPGDKVFVVQFSKDIELLQGPTDERPKLEMAISQLGTSSATFHAAEPREDTLDSEGRKVHHGGTSLDDAIYLASDEVLANEKSKHVLIVFSDGADDGSKESAGDMLEAVMRNHVLIFGVFSRNADELTKKAREESRGTGGNGPGGGNGGGRSGGSGFPFPGGGGYPGQSPGSQQPNGGSSGGGNKPGATPSRRPDVDGFGALKKLSEETGGRVTEYGKRGLPLEEAFTSVAGDLQAMYWLTFTPQGASTRHGVHPFDVEVAGADKSKKVDVQTSDDFYVQ